MIDSYCCPLASLGRNMRTGIKYHGSLGYKECNVRPLGKSSSLGSLTRKKKE